MWHGTEDALATLSQAVSDQFCLLELLLASMNGKTAINSLSARQIGNWLDSVNVRANEYL